VARCVELHSRVFIVGRVGQEQYQWDPYGTLVSKQTTASPAPVNRVGHQGLFFYRFDGSTGGPFTTAATGLYYNRSSDKGS